MRFAVGLILLLSLAAAPPATPPGKEGPKGTVTGIAVDAKDNVLADCVVSATQSGQRMRVADTVETDTGGKFSIDLPEGSWTITITTKDTKLKGAKTADVEAGKTVDVGKVTLRPRKVGSR